MSKGTQVVEFVRNSRGVKAGDRVEVPKETAARLLANGHARKVESKKSDES